MDVCLLLLLWILIIIMSDERYKKKSFNYEQSIFGWFKKKKILESFVVKKCWNYYFSNKKSKIISFCLESESLLQLMIENPKKCSFFFKKKSNDKLF